MRFMPAVFLASIVLVSSSVVVHPARAAAQSDCQTEECKRARSGEEHRCKSSPPISLLPADQTIRRLA